MKTESFYVAQFVSTKDGKFLEGEFAGLDGKDPYGASLHPMNRSVARFSKLHHVLDFIRPYTDRGLVAMKVEVSYTVSIAVE